MHLHTPPLFVDSNKNLLESVKRGGVCKCIYSVVMIIKRKINFKSIHQPIYIKNESKIIKCCIDCAHSAGYGIPCVFMSCKTCCMIWLTFTGPLAPLDDYRPVGWI